MTPEEMEAVRPKQDPPKWFVIQTFDTEDERDRFIEIQRLTQEIAVDHCWCAIESASLNEELDGVEWMDVREDAEALHDEFRLLLALALAEVHPVKPTWIREIAEL
jgi:hypothetical protein